MTKPPIFIELCAGTAALSLRLQGGPKAKPPVSRMGAKTGYADAILAVLGLYPGQGAESYLWCEPDDGVRGLLMAYPQPEVLRAAAAVLRGWKDEEPRALWERLRAELKAGASVEGAEGVARYILVIGQTWPHKMDWRPMSQWAQKTKEDGGVCLDTLIEQARSMPSPPPTFIARDGRAVTPEEVAGWMALGQLSYRQMEPESGFNPGMSSDARSPCWRPSIAELSGAVARMAQATFPPVTIVADGRVVTPEEVARSILVGVWSYKQMEPESGFVGVAIETRKDADAIADCVDVAAAANWPPVTLAADARTLTPPRLPEGVVCYMDPPYLDTTGYKHDLSRAEVVRMARLWADAGATVCISEAEPIPDLVADGWHAVEISATRKGQKRTFSKQQAEWLTLSRPPSFVPRQTLDLFGGDR